MFLLTKQWKYFNRFILFSFPISRNVNYNEISWTIEDANGVFRGLNNLKKLFLVGNDIKSINSNAFVGLKNVTLLNLDNNNITSIQKNSFNELHSLKSLIINTASLICDCNLQWFVEWLHEKDFKTNTMYCAYPEGMRAKLLFEVATSNFTCGNYANKSMRFKFPVEIRVHIRLSHKTFFEFVEYH